MELKPAIFVIFLVSLLKNSTAFQLWGIEVKLKQLPGSTNYGTLYAETESISIFNQMLFKEVIPKLLDAPNTITSSISSFLSHNLQFLDPRQQNKVQTETENMVHHFVQQHAQMLRESVAEREILMAETNAKFKELMDKFNQVSSQMQEDYKKMFEDSKKKQDELNKNFDEGMRNIVDSVPTAKPPGSFDDFLSNSFVSLDKVQSKLKRKKAATKNQKIEETTTAALLEPKNNTGNKYNASIWTFFSFLFGLRIDEYIY